MTFKYSVGERVWYIDDIYTVIQRRIDNGHITYRLDNNSIVHERLLK